MKTEASETTEDEVVRYLEAEVDAMAAREIRGLGMAGDILDVTDEFSGPRGMSESYSGTGADLEDLSHLSRAVDAQSSRFGNPAQNATATGSFGIQDLPDWPASVDLSRVGLRDNIHPPPPMGQLHSNLLRRHSRSMTPSGNPNRQGLPSIPGNRFHPYTLPSLAESPQNPSSVQRSSSVDSFQLPAHMTAVPSTQLLPGVSHTESRSHNIFRHQPIPRSSYQYQSADSAAPASIFPSRRFEQADLIEGTQIGVAAEAVAEASGFTEWANGSV